MHELALAEAVVEIVQTETRKAGGGRVRVVRLAVGALSHADPEALRFCFDAVAKGTLADGARLDITAVPGQAQCTGCGAEVIIAAWGEACPRCGAAGLTVTGGEELKVSEIEVG